MVIVHFVVTTDIHSMFIEFIRRFAKQEKPSISRSLLWDQDLESFDWNENKVLVVQRVIERGWPDDFCAAAAMYGGEAGFREIIKEIPYLSDKDMNFVCVCFDLKKEELRCYRNKLYRQAHFRS